jgi:hypothetical protein
VLFCLLTLSNKAYDPTIEDAYRKQVVIDDEYVFVDYIVFGPLIQRTFIVSVCHVEIVDTAGQGAHSIFYFGSGV